MRYNTRWEVRSEPAGRMWKSPEVFLLIQYGLINNSDKKEHLQDISDHADGPAVYSFAVGLLS